MTKLPLALIYSRLALGFIVLVCSVLHVNNYSTIAVVLLSIGLLTDIFDGIIARRLNVSNQKLRRMDSSVDQLFFLSIALATYIQCPDFFYANWKTLGLLFGFEISTYLLCYLKFRKEVATHSIGAKIWTLFLFGTLVQIIATCDSPIFYSICLYLGIITRIEILFIILILRKWTNDVPTFYHAIKLRKGKEIKRNKLFNG